MGLQDLIEDFSLVVALGLAMLARIVLMREPSAFPDSLRNDKVQCQIRSASKLQSRRQCALQHQNSKVAARDRWDSFVP